MIISVCLRGPFLVDSLVWNILWSALHLIIVLHCLHRDSVYCKSAVMTCLVNDGFSIGVLLQIVSIFQIHIDSGWGSCFPSLTASSLHVWYLREEFAFDSIFRSLSCGNSIDSHMCLWKLNSPICSCLQGKTVWVYCHEGYIAIHLSGMHPLENLCSSRLVCIFIWTPQPDPYFNMTAKGRPPLFS